MKRLHFIFIKYFLFLFIIVFLFTGCDLFEGENGDMSTISGYLGTSRAFQVDGHNVTHVMAINPETKESKYSEVGPNGVFHLDVEKGYPWTFLFLDDEQVGIDMLISAFKSDSLDSLAVTKEAKKNIDLGSLNVKNKAAAINKYFMRKVDCVVVWLDETKNKKRLSF